MINGLIEVADFAVSQLEMQDIKRETRSEVPDTKKEIVIERQQKLQREKMGHSWIFPWILQNRKKTNVEDMNEGLTRLPPTVAKTLKYRESMKLKTTA